jgi:hypothetical protein
MKTDHLYQAAHVLAIGIEQERAASAKEGHQGVPFYLVRAQEHLGQAIAELVRAVEQEARDQEADEQMKRMGAV